MADPTHRVCRLLRVALTLAGIACCAMASAKGRSVLLQSRVGAGQQVRESVEALIRAMGHDAPVHGRALRRLIEQKLSSPAGPGEIRPPIRSDVERGRLAVIEGQYDAAIRTLEHARKVLLRHSAAVSANQGLRDMRYTALLLLGHAYLRTKQPGRATEHLSEAIRSFPRRMLSSIRYAPDLVRLYRRVRAALGRRQRATLRVDTEPPGCLVFVNERFVGVSPVPATDLHPGNYRIYLRREHEGSRVNHVSLADGRAVHAVIDFDLQRALRTEPFVGLQFDDAASQRGHEVRFAAAIGQRVGAASVVLLGHHAHRGQRALRGAVISTATGRVVRSGMVLLQPAPSSSAPPSSAPPSSGTFVAFGKFLLVGQRAPGIIVADAGAPASAAQHDTSRLWSAGVWKWVTAALAAGALAGGATLVALDDTCAERTDILGMCRSGYNTAAAGIGLLAGAGALTAASVYLFFTDARTARPDRRSLTLWLRPDTAGLLARGQF